MRRANGNLHYYLNDHLGSAWVVLDSAGTVKDKQWYYAFGSERSSTVNTGQRYLYTGKPFDDDDGVDLYYYGARYYDAAIGRFTSVDPLVRKYPGWSPYVYVRNNPLLRLDLGGLTDITFTVKRTAETKISTIGNFTLSNSGDKKVVTGATLEKPWKNNQEYKSRIPAGSYDASLRTTKGTFGYPRITLKNVPGRTKIVIHRGNTEGDTEGCILVGKTAGNDRVNKSKAALTETTNYIKKIQAADKKKGEETKITVRVIDPPKEQERIEGQE